VDVSARHERVAHRTNCYAAEVTCLQSWLKRGQQSDEVDKYGQHT